MSRITDALARAELRKNLSSTAAADVVVPWDFGPDPEAAVPVSLEAVVRAPEEAPAPVAPAVYESTPLGPVSTDVFRPATVALDRLAGAVSEKLIVSGNISPEVVEQYRRVGAILHHAQSDHNIRVVMIASALAAEGKTLVASNLALTLSRSYGRRVLLLDGDLRCPSLHTVFGLDNGEGIVDRLDAHSTEVSPVQLSPNLFLLTAGRKESDPIRILTGTAMQRLVDDAAKQYDWVILDTPPVALLADANLLASMVDTVLLVIEAGRTPYDVIQKSVELIGRDRIIGTVLNRADAAAAGAYARVPGPPNQPS